MRRVADWIITARLPLLALCLTSAAILYPLSQRIKRDRSVYSFFDPGHPRLNDYTKAQDDFGGDTVCIAAYTDPELLTSEGLDRLDAFAKELANTPGILKGNSLANLPRPSQPLSPRPLIEWFARPGADVAALRQEVLDCPLYADQFVGADGRTAAIVLLADPIAMGSGAFTETLDALRAKCDRHAPRARLVGAPVMINDVYDFLDEDAWVLANVSTLAMMGVILVLFRSIRWMVLPILVVQVSLIWIKALMATLGLDLSLMDSLTTSMVTVIGIGTAIHIAVRFQEEINRQPTPREALAATIAEVMPAVFWTCATTAAGFGSLAISKVAPVRDFGWVMGVSAMFVFVASFMIVPGGVLFGKWVAVPKPVPAERSLVGGLHLLGDWVLHHGVLATLINLSAIGVALVGLSWLEVETDFTRNFRANSRILDGYRFVEERLGGAGLVDLSFAAPSEITPDFLDTMRRCQDNLRRLPGVTKVIGLTDFLDFASRSTGGSVSAGALARNLQLTALRMAQPREIAQFWNYPQRQMRMVLRVREQQTSAEKDRLLSSIGETASAALNRPATVTGLYVLLVHLIESLLGDQLLSFLISCVLILSMTLVAFRDLRLGIVGFLPNLIPIAIVMGTMGWLGLKINVATAMMSSISMGLTVDFSIHYLSRFRQERDAGEDFFTAIRRTNRSTGKAMFCANLALMLGFGLLTFSNLLPTMQFGMLISVAMAGGLIGNLMMLPVLLRIAFWL